MKPPTHTYVGRAPCGCVKAIASYGFEFRAGTGRDVAGMIRDGLIVSCMTFEEFKAAGIWLDDCPHGEIVDENTTQPALL